MSEETQADVLKVTLKADKARFAKFVTVDQLIQMQEGNVRTIRDVLSYFVLDDGGQYYPIGYDLKFQKHVPNKQAVDKIGLLTIEQMNESAASFMRDVEGQAVPPQSAPD